MTKSFVLICLATGLPCIACMHVTRHCYAAFHYYCVNISLRFSLVFEKITCVKEVKFLKGPMAVRPSN